jgi:hypothetical protein
VIDTGCSVGPQFCAFWTRDFGFLDDTNIAGPKKSVHTVHMTRTSSARKSNEEAEQAQERFRIASLKGLIAELKRGDALSREDFAKLFAKAQRILELDDYAVARALQISRPTVGRWTRGESAPHPLGRRPALMWLAKEASHRLKQHR